MDEGGTNLFWAERFGKEIGVERPLDQDVRQLAHRILQGPRHDGARVRRQADDGGRRGHARGGVRVDGRHVGRARGLRGRGGHSRDRDPAARHGHAGAARAAARERREGPRARHRLRRLHEDRPAAGQRRRRLPRQLDEQPPPRGPEDDLGRDRPAVRLGGAGRHHHPGRQPRQRQRARRGLRPDAGARPHREEAAHCRRAGGRGQSAVPRVQNKLAVRADHGGADAGVRDPHRQPRVDSRRPSARCSSTTASSSRRRSSSWPTRRLART